MGAEAQTYLVEAKDQSELFEKYDALVKRALYDLGHAGYTGSIAESPGLTLKDGEWTEAEAEDYVFERGQKWENSSAFKMKDLPDTYLIGGVYSS